MQVWISNNNSKKLTCIAYITKKKEESSRDTKKRKENLVHIYCDCNLVETRVVGRWKKQLELPWIIIQNLGFGY